MSYAQKEIPPTIQGIELYRMMPKFRRETLKTFSELTRRCGHVIRFKGLWTSFMLTHPLDVEHVLQRNAQNYRKGRGFRVMKEATGNGLFVSEGELWRRQRRLAQPAFHRGRIRRFADTIVNLTQEMLNKDWQTAAANQTPVDVMAEMTRLTLRIVGETLFSTDLTKEADAIRRMLDIGRAHALRRVFAIIKLPLGVPTPANLRFRAAMRAGDEIIYRMIDERRQARVGAAPDDLLSMLLEARDEDTSDGMSDQQLRDETFTIMVAGHESTAVALAWTWHLLARHAAARIKLQAEVREVLNGRAPTFDDLPKLKYTTMVFQEALRLYPPAWTLGRAAIEDDEISGYKIPANSEILLFPYITQRHPDFWNDAESFKPERFVAEQIETRPRLSYFPFGAGPRQCIGNNFAMMEAQLILATIAQKFQLHSMSNKTIEAEASITLRPRERMLMVLQRI